MSAKAAALTVAGTLAAVTVSAVAAAVGGLLWYVSEESRDRIFIPGSDGPFL